MDAGVSFPPIIRFDKNHLTLILKQIAQEVDLPPREGTLSISGLEVSGTSGEPGRMLDQTKTRAAIAPLLEAGTGGTVDLVVEERLPAVMSVDAAIAEARALLGKSLVLVAEGSDGTQRFAIDPATLRSWLDAPSGSGARRRGGSEGCRWTRIRCGPSCSRRQSSSTVRPSTRRWISIPQPTRSWCFSPARPGKASTWKPAWRRSGRRFCRILHSRPQRADVLPSGPRRSSPRH